MTNKAREHGQEVSQLQGVNQTPDDKSGDHIQGPVGEIGQAAEMP